MEQLNLPFDPKDAEARLAAETAKHVMAASALPPLVAAFKLRILMDTAPPEVRRTLREAADAFCVAEDRCQAAIRILRRSGGR